MRFVLVIILMIAANSCASNIQRTVSELAIPSYLGRWYQVYGDYVSAAVIERGGYCITATYSNGPNNTISVLNSERLKSPNGTVISMRGYAYVPNSSEPGQLSLKLDNVPFTGSYWVLALGPIKDNLYEWSVVSDKNFVTLFILARNVTSFKINYDRDVLRKVEKLGFKGFSKPIPSYQGSDCEYAQS